MVLEEEDAERNSSRLHCDGVCFWRRLFCGSKKWEGWDY